MYGGLTLSANEPLLEDAPPLRRALMSIVEDSGSSVSPTSTLPTAEDAGPSSAEASFNVRRRSSLDSHVFARERILLLDESVGTTAVKGNPRDSCFEDDCKARELKLAFFSSFN